MAKEGFMINLTLPTDHEKVQIRNISMKVLFRTMKKNAYSRIATTHIHLYVFME
jgi:hypothetical protein